MFTCILLDHETLSDGDELSGSDCLDLGAYGSLGFVLTVHEAGAGDAPVLIIEHAITNEDEAFVSFDPAIDFALDQAGTASAMVVPFLRWVRWRVGGTLSSAATVSLSVLAKS